MSVASCSYELCYLNLFRLIPKFKSMKARPIFYGGQAQKFLRTPIAEMQFFRRAHDETLLDKVNR